MIFKDSAVVTEVWAHKTEFRKGKIKTVSGRNYHSLSFRPCGRVLFEVDGKRHISEGGGITFMPAGVSYQTQVLSEGELWVVHFMTAVPFPKASPVFLDKADADIKSVLSELCESYQAGEEHKYKRMSLIYTLLERTEHRLRPVPRRLRQAKDYIDTHFAEDISIAALAKKAGLSDVHFRNEFKKYFEQSPLSYLKTVRLENAKLLLRSGYYSVSDTALDCGFGSISYFSAEYKRLTGMSPSEYLQQNGE